MFLIISCQLINYAWIAMHICSINGEYSLHVDVSLRLDIDFNSRFRYIVHNGMF